MARVGRGTVAPCVAGGPGSSRYGFSHPGPRAPGCPRGSPPARRVGRPRRPAPTSEAGQPRRLSRSPRRVRPSRPRLAALPVRPCPYACRPTPRPAATRAQSRPSQCAPRTVHVDDGAIPLPAWAPRNAWPDTCGATSSCGLAGIGGRHRHTTVVSSASRPRARPSRPSAPASATSRSGQLPEIV